MHVTGGGNHAILFCVFLRLLDTGESGNFPSHPEVLSRLPHGLGDCISGRGAYVVARRSREIAVSFSIISHLSHESERQRSSFEPCRSNHGKQALMVVFFSEIHCRANVLVEILPAIKGRHAPRYRSPGALHAE